MPHERLPNLRFPPPAIFAGAFFGGLLLETVLRIRIVGDLREPLLSLFGFAVLALGFFLMLWGATTFWRHGTSVLPFRPVSAFVQTGPYRFTRNPMYLGMTVVHIGGALALNAGWPLILLPLAIYLIVRLVIRPEEEYLTERFGSEYEAFKRRVRRWF